MEIHYYKEELNRWSKVSHKIAGLLGGNARVPHISYRIQRIGRLNIELQYREKIPPTTDESKIFDFDNTLYMSDLWLLDAYEITRILKVETKEPDNESRGLLVRLTDEQKAKLIGLKDQFERVRIPVAKFRSANKFKNIDDEILMPILTPDHCIGWRLNDNEYITRKELSNKFLSTLENL